MLFPMMAASDLEALAADIAAHGQREPILRDTKGRIIDGRNRERACLMAGRTPKYRTYTPAQGESEILSLIISRNLHRRHMSDSQRAMVAARIADMQQGAATP